MAEWCAETEGIDIIEYNKFGRGYLNIIPASTRLCMLGRKLPERYRHKSDKGRTKVHMLNPKA
jgi:hypothetical protein